MVATEEYWDGRLMVEPDRVEPGAAIYELRRSVRNNRKRQTLAPNGVTTLRSSKLPTLYILDEYWLGYFSSINASFTI